MPPKFFPPARRVTSPLLKGPPTIGRSLALRPAPRLVARAGPATARDIALRPRPIYPEVRPNPFVDFSEGYTAGGGIVFQYKDVDESTSMFVGKLFFWTIATIVAAIYLRHMAPGSIWVRLAEFIVILTVNWICVGGPREILRQVEIRPDGMIFDGVDVFWREAACSEGFPEFSPSGDGLKLTGTYGTRKMHYMSIRRFDPNDRSPEVFARRFNAALRQLWMGVAQPGSLSQ